MLLGTGAFIQNCLLMSDYEYEAARRRIRQKRNYFRRIAFYGVLTALLAAINLITSPGALWFPWAVLGFGIDLIVKYFQVFGFPGGAGSEDWEAREMEKEIRRLESGRREEDEELELRELEKPKRPKNWDDDELV